MSSGSVRSEETRSSARWDCDITLISGGRTITANVGGAQIGQVELRCSNTQFSGHVRSLSEETRSARWDCDSKVSRRTCSYLGASEETRSARWDCDPKLVLLLMTGLPGRRRSDQPDGIAT
jgi:hypothetical protein